MCRDIEINIVQWPWNQETILLPIKPVEFIHFIGLKSENYLKSTLIIHKAAQTRVEKSIIDGKSMIVLILWKLYS